MRAASEVVRVLARSCAATAVVTAMHYYQSQILVRHGTSEVLRGYLERAAREQLLIANATSEVGMPGGGLASRCAVETEGGTFRLEKHASVVSYGAHADSVLASARSGPDSASTDQALVLCIPPGLELEQAGDWDTIGLRGTCSPPFRIVAEGSTGQIIPDLAHVDAQTALPAYQILLASAWVGVAEAIAERSHRFVRAQARKQIGVVPPSALDLAELGALLQLSRDALESVLTVFERIDGTDEIEDISFGLRIMNLKVSTTSLLLQIANRAVDLIGLAAYSQTSPYSMSRFLRDAHGAPLMVSNRRFVSESAQRLIARKTM
jgi:acyl-CoA dehydrogenase